MPLRFVVLVVKSKPRNYALTTFTASTSNPRKVLPLVNELADSFHVLPRKLVKKR